MSAGEAIRPPTQMLKTAVYHLHRPFVVAFVEKSSRCTVVPLQFVLLLLYQNLTRVLQPLCYALHRSCTFVKHHLNLAQPVKRFDVGWPQSHRVLQFALSTDKVALLICRYPALHIVQTQQLQNSILSHLPFKQFAHQFFCLFGNSLDFRWLGRRLRTRYRLLATNKFGNLLLFLLLPCFLLSCGLLFGDSFAFGRHRLLLGAAATKRNSKNHHKRSNIARHTISP